MYPYRNPYAAHDQRFLGFGFGLPFIGGLLGGFLGSALISRPYYGGFGGYPGIGYPGIGYPGFGYPGPGFGGNPYFY